MHTRYPDEKMSLSTNLDGLVGYLETFSALKTLLENLKEGESSPIVNVTTQLKEVISSEDSVEVCWPVFMYLCSPTSKKD